MMTTRPIFAEKAHRVSHDRLPGHAVDPLFLHRWSPRAFDSTPIPESVVLTLLEAARWSPSGSNQQPWLFVYALSPEERDRFVPLLEEGNQRWAAAAPVLGFIFARRRNDRGDENLSAAFDTGAAWMAMTLQARSLGLYTHAMGGIRRDAAYEALGVSAQDYQVMCGFALGRRGDPKGLPEDLQAREKPSDRRPLEDVVRRSRY